MDMDIDAVRCGDFGLDGIQCGARACGQMQMAALPRECMRSGESYPLGSTRDECRFSGELKVH